MSTGRNAPILRFLPFSLATFTLVASFLLANALVRRDLAQQEARATAEAKHVASQLRAGALTAFEPLQRIAAWWLLEGRPLAPEDWESDSQLFVSPQSGLESVTWILPTGKQSWSVRPGVASEPNVLEPLNPELASTVAVAQQKRSLSVSRVFDRNGRVSLYACFPLFREARLRGFVAGLYDVSTLIGSVLQDQLPVDYSVTVNAGGRQVAVMGKGAPRTGSMGPNEPSIMLANAVWSVRLTPSATKIVAVHRLIVGFGILVSTLIYACTAMALVTRRRTLQLAEANQQLRVENSERRRAEDKIQQLNRDLQWHLHEFQVLLEVLPIGIAVAEDAECRKIWTNPSMAAMLQVPPGQNISKSDQNPNPPAYQLLLNGGEVSPDLLPMQVAARTGKPVANQELEIVRADGTAISTLSFSAPLFDESGGVRGVIDACVDITDRKRAEEERRLSAARGRELEQRLERAERYRGFALMAGGVAHDFNNLLTVILGHSNLLAAAVPPASKARHHVNELTIAANRAAYLTSQLRAFTGHIWCEARPVDLSAEIRSLEPAIREWVPASLSIEYALAPKLPTVSAGIPELHQVIQHLVSNSVEALEGREGKIEIRTSTCDFSSEQIEAFFPDQSLSPGTYVSLEIVDNGCGIPEDLVRRVFDPFFTTKFVGRGLGLSAAQGLVRAQGGGIHLESSVDFGTRVEVIIPVQPAGDSAHVPAILPAFLGGDSAPGASFPASLV